MSLYKTRPINKTGETNPYIETDYKTNQIEVGQPVPYRLQKYLDREATILESLEDFVCLKCKINLVEKKVFEKGFNYKFLVLYRRSFCKYCHDQI